MKPLKRKVYHQVGTITGDEKRLPNAEIWDTEDDSISMEIIESDLYVVRGEIQDSEYRELRASLHKLRASMRE